jgi:hypothetical protein
LAAHFKVYEENPKEHLVLALQGVYHALGLQFILRWINGFSLAVFYSKALRMSTLSDRGIEFIQKMDTKIEPFGLNCYVFKLAYLVRMWSGNDLF